jgi:predicted transcriptional regulator YheO
MNIEKLEDNMNFDFFIRFAEGLQQFLGDQCEIVVHDFRKGFDHSIVYIFNGQISGREVGGHSRGAMLSHAGEDIDKYMKSKIYFFSGIEGGKGKIFKSCTTLIKDSHNKIIGSVCLNLNVADMISAQHTLQNFVKYSMPSLSAMKEEDIDFSNVDDVLTFYMKKSEKVVGKPMQLMNKEEKVRALKYLNDKGVFKITKAGVLLCQAFQVSKYTLYSYLEEAKQLDTTDEKKSENPDMPAQDEEVEAK